MASSRLVGTGVGNSTRSGYALDHGGRAGGAQPVPEMGSHKSKPQARAARPQPESGPLLIIGPMATLNTAVVFFTALRISAELTPKRGQEFGTAKLLVPVGLGGDGARRWNRARPLDRLIRWLRAVKPPTAVHCAWPGGHAGRFPGPACRERLVGLLPGLLLDGVSAGGCAGWCGAKGSTPRPAFWDGSL
jgi:hypothetical protein